MRVRGRVTLWGRPRGFGDFRGHQPGPEGLLAHQDVGGEVVVAAEVLGLDLDEESERRTRPILIGEVARIRMGGEQSNNTVGAKTIRTIPPSIAKKRHGNENADDRGKLVRTISPSYAKKRGAANPPTNVRGKQTRFIPPSHAQKRAIDADDINDNGKIVRVNSPERYDSPALEQLPEKSKKKQTIPRSKSQKRKMDDDYGQVKKYINLERGYKRKIDDGLGGVKKYRHLENGYTPKIYTHHVIKGQKRKPEDFIESVSKYRHLENGAHPKVYIHPTIKGEKRPSDTVLGGVKKYQNLEISDAAPSLQELQEIWADEIEQVYE